MEGIDPPPTNATIKEAFGEIGDQDIETESKPTETTFLKELAILQGVDPNIEPETLKGVLENIIENDRLEEKQETHT